jgi:hypothetical protein
MNARFHILNNERKTIDELVGFSRGVLADGIVNDAEAHAFRAWIDSLPRDRLCWPFDEIKRRLERIFSDGIIADDERAELADIMRQLGGVSEETERNGSTSLPLDVPWPLVNPRAAFCATGRFAFGPRREVFAEIERRGGQVHESPKLETGFLIIGTFSSPDWAYTTYGRKIEQAVALRERGCPLKIIAEEHWLNARL